MLNEPRKCVEFITNNVEAIRSITPFIEHLICLTLCANESKSLIDPFFFSEKYSANLLWGEYSSKVIYCL